MQLFKVKGNYKSGFAGETNPIGETLNNNNNNNGAVDQQNTETK
jgi:hypothetical protein